MSRIAQFCVLVCLLATIVTNSHLLVSAKSVDSSKGNLAKPTVKPSQMPEYASFYTRESCIRESGQAVMANRKELNDDEYTCASWFFVLGTHLRITNLRNSRMVIVEVTDRGPSKRLVRAGRTIDLSEAAFAAIADLQSGIIPVKIEVIND